MQVQSDSPEIQKSTTAHGLTLSIHGTRHLASEVMQLLHLLSVEKLGSVVQRLSVIKASPEDRSCIRHAIVHDVVHCGHGNHGGKKQSDCLVGFRIQNIASTAETRQARACQEYGLN